MNKSIIVFGMSLFSGTMPESFQKLSELNVQAQNRIEITAMNSPSLNSYQDGTFVSNKKNLYKIPVEIEQISVSRLIRGTLSFDYVQCFYQAKDGGSLFLKNCKNKGSGGIVSVSEINSTTVVLHAENEVRSTGEYKIRAKLNYYN